MPFKELKRRCKILNHVALRIHHAAQPVKITRRRMIGRLKADALVKGANTHALYYTSMFSLVAFLIHAVDLGITAHVATNPRNIVSTNS